MHAACVAKSSIGGETTRSLVVAVVTGSFATTLSATVAEFTSVSPELDPMGALTSKKLGEGLQRTSTVSTRWLCLEQDWEAWKRTIQ